MYDNRLVPPRTGRSAASPGPNGRALACVGLGWFSIGLGLAELAAPGNLAGLIGINQRRGLIRSPGVREISSGLGILSKTQPAAFLWSRVAGDAMDLALLARRPSRLPLAQPRPHYRLRGGRCRRARPALQPPCQRPHQPVRGSLTSLRYNGLVAHFFRRRGSALLALAALCSFGVLAVNLVCLLTGIGAAAFVDHDRWWPVVQAIALAVCGVVALSCAELIRSLPLGRVWLRLCCGLLLLRGFLFLPQLWLALPSISLAEFAHVIFSLLVLATGLIYGAGTSLHVAATGSSR